MYFLGTDLMKERFAATTIYFFLLLNVAKLVSFIGYGRLNKEQLLSELWMLPILPVGVLLGFYIVRVMPDNNYRPLANITLALSSLGLVWQGA